jgi:sigma-E factor negative regulatory protein RseA
MERISAFMDGELEAEEGAGQIRRLKDDPEARGSWEVYHLIGDAVRGESGLSTRFTQELGARLAAEPTVLAPHPKIQPRTVRRIALSAAASVGGVALVAWLALVNNPFQPQQNLALNQQPVLPQADTAPANGAVNDYLLAHQQFSPSTAMQGVASYVRTVSGRETDMR